ncbi:hypothetical protein LZ554_003285 [Drepanopeziza brunnea f. sp. 'monogermtubi']|nr:hypothetical protein LZ554_003285 [Drepanopeziza brunnea f. sp. 'monogermtubi']
MASICNRCVGYAANGVEMAANRCLFSHPSSIKCDRCRALRTSCIALPEGAHRAGVALLDAMDDMDNGNGSARAIFDAATKANDLLTRIRRAAKSRSGDASFPLRPRANTSSPAAANVADGLAGLDPVPILRLPAAAAAAPADPTSLDLLRQILAAVDRNNTLLATFVNHMIAPDAIPSPDPAPVVRMPSRPPALSSSLSIKSDTSSSSSSFSQPAPKRLRRGNRAIRSRGNSGSNFGRTSRGESRAKGAAKGMSIVRLSPE